MSQPPEPAAPPPALHRVVVLAGGGSTRLGQDKTRVELAGVPVLDHLLLGLAAAVPGVLVTVVGEPRPTAVTVTWRREEPPGGGPVAAIAAGAAGVPDDGVLAVLAGDQPFAAVLVPRLAHALERAGDGVDSVLARDPDGRDQLLLGVHRWGPLRAAVGDEPNGRSVRSVVRGLRLEHLVGAAHEVLDVDTAADLARARQLADEGLRR